MSTKSRKNKAEASERLLLILTFIFLLPVILVGGWYGFMHLSVRQNSRILPQELIIHSAESQCTLVIPEGSLSIHRPRRAAVGTKYRLDAEVSLDEPIRFTGCSGKLPNWNVSLEAQTMLPGALVEPFAAIRQPAFDRSSINYHWTFVPEEPIATFQSSLWLRVIISEGGETVENWSLLVREFPMSYLTLFGQPLVFWLILAGASGIIGILFLILWIQKRQRNRAG